MFLILCQLLFSFSLSNDISFFIIKTGFFSKIHQNNINIFFLLIYLPIAKISYVNRRLFLLLILLVSSVYEESNSNPH